MDSNIDDAGTIGRSSNETKNLEVDMLKEQKEALSVALSALNAVLNMIGDHPSKAPELVEAAAQQIRAVINLEELICQLKLKLVGPQ